jgi:signal transduction histidine kinase
MKEPINILLVEDNADDVLLLKRILAAEAELAFILNHQSSLPQALAALDGNSFDIILLDLSLPGSSGLETFTCVHARCAEIPIIVLTGLSDEELATLAVRLGAQDYLVKGRINPSLIVRAIRYAIERKRAEEKMITYQKQLRSLASQLALAEERERRRIATELHDHIGQNLAIAKIKLGLLKESAAGLAGPLKEIQTMIEQAIGYTRSLTFELSPPLLYEFGFEAAVEWLSERIHEQYNIRVEFNNDPSPKPLSDDVRVLLFQAVRELLNNVVKHAKTSQAFLTVDKDAHDIRITVEDDGRGFNVAQAFPTTARPNGFGLFNIRERLNQFGGKMKIDSQPDRGTRITLTAPLKQEPNPGVPNASLSNEA